YATMPFALPPIAHVPNPISPTTIRVMPRSRTRTSVDTRELTLYPLALHRAVVVQVRTLLVAVPDHLTAEVGPRGPRMARAIDEHGDRTPLDRHVLTDK